MKHYDDTTTPERRGPYRVLLLGGIRSGKSEEAERRLLDEPVVTYLAAGPRLDDDPEWQARIAAHRSRRPAHWVTVESIEVARLLRTENAALLIDGLGTWLAAVFDECAGWSDGGMAKVAVHVDELVRAWRDTRAYVVAVSDEVGLGLVPTTPSGRAFADQLGLLNQRLAAESDEVALVVAGRALPLPRYR